MVLLYFSEANAIIYLVGQTMNLPVVSDVTPSPSVLFWVHTDNVPQVEWLRYNKNGLLNVLEAEGPRSGSPRWSAKGLLCPVRQLVSRCIPTWRKRIRRTPRSLLTSTPFVNAYISGWNQLPKVLLLPNVFIWSVRITTQEFGEDEGLQARSWHCGTVN